MKAIDKFDYPRELCPYCKANKCKGKPIEKGLDILYSCESPLEVRKGWDNLNIIPCNILDYGRCPQGKRNARI